MTMNDSNINYNSYLLKGYLIYKQEDIKRNIYFINRLIDEFSKLNISLTLISSDNLNKTKLSDVNFVINRSFDPYLTKELEQTYNKIVFNNYLTGLIGNNKLEAYYFFKKNNIPCMETYDITKVNAKNLKFPLILKSLDGHGGKEVFFINSYDEYSYKIIEELNKNKNKKYLLQQVATTKGKDFRVYMIKDKVVATCCRESLSDFRSNYSLGGYASLVTNPNEEIIETSKFLAKKIKSTYVGIDFIYNKDRYVVNEIEDCVGSRMLYSLTNKNSNAIDIALLFVNEIYQRLTELFPHLLLKK